MNNAVRLGRGELSGTVRLGIAMDSLHIEQWKADVISSLLSEPAILVPAIFLLGEGAVQLKPRLLAEYEKWSERVAAPFQRVNLASVLDGIPKITFGTAPGRELPEGDRESIRSQNLDVLLWLGARRQLDCRGLARQGVWSFEAGTAATSRCLPPFVAENLDHEPVTQLLLVAHTSSLFEGCILTRQITSTRESWYITLTAAEATKNAATMLLRRLIDLVSVPERRGAREAITLPDVPTFYPSMTSLLRYLGRQVIRSTAARIRAKGRRLQWFVAARKNDQQITSSADCFTSRSFERLAADSEEADPFLVEWNGQEALFVEEVPRTSGRGRISCRPMRDEKFLAPVPVIDAAYHLSYPHVFEVDGQLFMIPESSANRTVELYRCVEFPLHWELQKVLCEGVPLVDTTVLFQGDTWYFFTTALETGELLLFFADSLQGAWHYHPQNPISMDVRCARNAGAFFTMGGKLIRPAQDCSVRYGYAIVLNEVLRISREEYEEVPIKTILPTWRPGLLGTHTLNFSPHMQVIDGLELAP